MNYTTLKTTERDYTLSLTCRSVEALEKRLGRNPVELIIDISDGKIPLVGDIVTILHESLQRFQHDISKEDAFEILDEYVDAGHTVFDFCSDVIVGLLRDAGLIAKEKQEDLSDPKDSPER